MASDRTHTTPKTYRVAIVLIVGMFAIWGLAHRLYDTLLPEFAAAHPRVQPDTPAAVRA